jgi:dCTP deaminase
VDAGCRVFVLGSTLERVRLPDDLVARLEGKSSLGRLDLLIHSTAGYVDPGWDGFLTLELSNVANLPITIYPGNASRFFEEFRRQQG